MPRRKKSTRSRKTRGRTRNSRRGVSAGTVKKIVKRAIAVNIENKTNQFNDSLNVSQSSSSSTGSSFIDDSIFCLSPGNSGNGVFIQQGTGQGERIGNRIKIKRAMLNINFTPTPYNADVNPLPSPQFVRMVFFYDRIAPIAVPTPGANGNFFQNGDTYSPFQGNLLDITRPYNLDRFRVLFQKTFKIGYQAYAGTGVNVTSQSFTNNDFKLNIFRKFNITKYLVKNVRWQDNLTTNPTTRALWCALYAVNANNIVVTATVPYTPVGCWYTVSIDYEDA